MARKRFQKSSTDVVLWVSSEEINRVAMQAIFSELLLAKSADKSLIGEATPVTPNELSFNSCQFTNDALDGETFELCRNIIRFRFQDCQMPPQQAKLWLKLPILNEQMKVVEMVNTVDHINNGYWRNIGYLSFWTALWRRQWWIEKNEHSSNELIHSITEYQNSIVVAAQLLLEFHWLVLFQSHLDLAFLTMPEFLQWQKEITQLLSTLKSRATELKNQSSIDERVLGRLTVELIADLQVMLPRVLDPEMSKSCEYNYYVMLANLRTLRYYTLMGIGKVSMDIILSEVNSINSIFKNAMDLHFPQESPALKWVRLASISFYFRVKQILIDNNKDHAFHFLEEKENSLKLYLSATKSLNYCAWGSAFLYDIAFGLYTCFEQQQKIFFNKKSSSAKDLAIRSVTELERLVLQGASELPKKLVCSLLFKNHHGVHGFKSETEHINYLMLVDKKIMGLFPRSKLTDSLQWQTKAIHGMHISQAQATEGYYRVVFQGANAIDLRSNIATRQANPPPARAKLSKGFLRSHPSGLGDTKPHTAIVDSIGKCTLIYSLNEIWRETIHASDRWKVFLTLYPTLPESGELLSYLQDWEQNIVQYDALPWAALIFDLHSCIANFSKTTRETHYCNAILFAVELFRVVDSLMEPPRCISNMNSLEKMEFENFQVLYRVAIDYCGFLLNPKVSEYAARISSLNWNELSAQIKRCYDKAKAYHERADVFTLESQRQVLELENTHWEAVRSHHQKAQEEQSKPLAKRVKKIKATPQPPISKTKPKNKVVVHSKPAEKKQSVAVSSDENVDETPSFFELYPPLKQLHAFLEKRNYPAAIHFAKKELDKLIVHDQKYPIIAYLCYVIADCQRMIEGKGVDDFSAKQFSMIAFEYLSQAMHYLNLSESLNLIEDHQLMQVFEFLKMTYDSCASVYESLSVMPAAVKQEQTFKFIFSEPLKALLLFLQQTLSTDEIYIFGSTPMAAVHAKLYPKEKNLLVRDTDIVIFVERFDEVCQLLKTVFPNLRPAFFNGLFRGQIDGLDVDIFIKDATKTNPILFVNQINMTCKSLLVTLTGDILDITGLAIDAIRNKEARIMPNILLAKNTITILNYIQTQIGYQFQGNSLNNLQLSTHLSLLRTVEPYILRKHFAKAFQWGQAKHAYQLWNQHHIFSVLLPMLYAVRGFLRNQFLQICEEWDVYFNKTGYPRWSTALGLIAALLKIVIEHAQMDAAPEEKATVAYNMVVESDAHLLKDFSIFDRVNILRLGGFETAPYQPNQTM